MLIPNGYPLLVYSAMYMPNWRCTVQGESGGIYSPDCGASAVLGRYRSEWFIEGLAKDRLSLRHRRDGVCLEHLCEYGPYLIHTSKRIFINRYSLPSTLDSTLPTWLYEMIMRFVDTATEKQRDIYTYKLNTNSISMTDEDNCSKLIGTVRYVRRKNTGK